MNGLGAPAIRFVDSHTAGEPTRVVISGGPDLGPGGPAERLALLRGTHDRFRSAVVCEPRGSDVLVGALLCAPSDPNCVTGVIFFNNVGYLGMCGHGTIGVVETLAHLGRITPGTHHLQTPVGTVAADLLPDGRVRVHNVPSRRAQTRVTVRVAGHGTVTGDVAWGGNWFFLTHDHGQALAPERIAHLTDFALRVRAGLEAAGITGDGGAAIDHVELFGPGRGGADGRSFVLCPGGAYDRSPCGTGTSAHLACLAAEGRLPPGRSWVQESIIGTRFEAAYTLEGGEVRPMITGSAFVTAEGTLRIDPGDPLRWGIPATGGA